MTQSAPAGLSETVLRADHEYAGCTELDWAEYEFATIEYDYKVHPDAARRILELFKKLYEAKP